MRKTIVILLCLAFIVGCSHSRQVRRRSNMMSYLYPKSSSPPTPNPQGARLQLPLRIGVAFVPAEPLQTARMWMPVQSTFPPDAEKRLLEIVRKSFQGRDWVSDIVPIPSNYLVPGGGFENLDQVAQLSGVEVVALVSVDQLQTSDPRRASFLYVSIIGAYMLPLDRNETRTLIDAAVFHVPTRTFLLRAPGVDRITGSSTAVDVDSKLRERSQVSFQRAMEDLAKNLDAEVDSFKASVASGERANIDIYTARGESVRQGGSFGRSDLPLLLLIMAMAMAFRKRP